MNKFNTVLAAALTISLTAAAQDFNSEYQKYIDGNVNRTGFNACPYEYAATPQTKAPGGYKTVYISTYGRHGSRSSWERANYNNVVFTLEQVKNAGYLSAAGDSLLSEVRMVIDGTDDSEGRLTSLGEDEHQGIARRLYERNRRFLRHCSGNVRATSSTVQRCIRSMAAFNLELNERCPRLAFRTDCGYNTQKYMSSDISSHLKAGIKSFRDSVLLGTPFDTESLYHRIFTDYEKGMEFISDAKTFQYDVYQAARIAPSFEIPYSIYRFLPKDAIYTYGAATRTYIYLCQANSAKYGTERMTLVQPLVNDVMEKAEAVLGGRDDTAVDLRFGHDYPFIALCSYIGLDGYEKQYTATEALEKLNNKFVCPFASNLQIMFFRSRSKSKPVLVKFLINEKETTIPGLEPAAKGIYYNWQDVKDWIAGRTPVKFMGPLSGRAINPKNGHHEGYQGMDIWDDLAVSAQNRGTACIYRLSGDSFTKLGEFKFGSYDEHNHSNVLSFLPVFYNDTDPLPLLGVSRAQKGTLNGLKDELYIERIAPDLQGSSVVRVINYADRKNDFGYALQWVIDRENNMLYGYGNTVSNKGESNRHRIIKFRIPDVLAEGPRMINLYPEDALENYLLEETYHEPFSPVGQGLFIKDGKLYMPCGAGDPERPSMLYIWDLQSRSMQAVDLTSTTSSELEDCSFYNGALIIQSQMGLWKYELRQ